MLNLREGVMFKDINVLEDFSCNPFQFFTPNGLLLAAGDSTQSNAMTISWGRSERCGED